MKKETAESALTEALRYDEQRRYERDPQIIAHCIRERDWWLNEAIRLERETTNG